MKTTRINDRLTQLTRLSFVNAYLVREDDGFTLVDTCVSRSGKSLLAAARAGRSADSQDRADPRSRRPRGLG